MFTSFWDLIWLWEHFWCRFPKPVLHLSKCHHHLFACLSPKLSCLGSSLSFIPCIQSPKTSMFLNSVITFLSKSVWVSCSCCGKWLPTLWLKMTEIYPPTVLEVRSLKSMSLDQNQNVNRTIFPLEPLGERSSLASSSFWWLLAFPGLWHVITSSVSLLMLPSLLSVSNLPGA